MQQRESAADVPELPESARRTAAELLELVQRATRDLFLEAEPLARLAALERLATLEDQG